MLLDFHSEIYAWIRGGLFILFVYHFLIYFQNKSKLYLYYSLYLLAFSIYLLKHVFYPNGTLFFQFTNFSVQFLGYAAYVAFARELLDTRTNLSIWDKYYEFAIKILLMLAGMFFMVEIFLDYEAQKMIFIIIAPILTLFALLSYYLIIKNIKNGLAYYFVFGSLLYVVLANVSFIEFFIGKEPFTSHGVQSIFFLYLGTIFQCIIFSLLIGIIIKKIEQKSKNAEVKLALKQKEMEELKMTALQSQMNPHFLFNSLNSINNFVIKNDVEKASDYITKFSKLIRVILNSSSSPISTLAEELEILALYVKMEQMRVTGGFVYDVTIGENINLGIIKVPPLFLQPFIENSIWHGIMKIEGPKVIELSIKVEDDSVICIVKDNGIGIDTAKERSYMLQKKKFFGIEATENRIRILYKNKGVFIETVDISNEEQSGTQVSIKFPYSTM